MPHYNKIAGFLAVGFVLLFLGKVSKSGLFTAYFKTIADVEVRNTQDLKESGATVRIAILTKSNSLQPLLSGLSGAWLVEKQLFLEAPEMVTTMLPSTCAYQYVSTHEFLTVAPTRAPGYTA